jgi:Uma2 family endonuclease
MVATTRHSAPEILTNMVATAQRRYSLDEYRAIAEIANEKCEYHDGEIITMTGGTLNQSLIMGNIFFFLKLLLRDTQFVTVNGEMRIWIPDYRCGVYTDTMVFNGKPQLNGDRKDEALNPYLIVEVLSPSTEEYDRTDKFQMYRSIPSFCEYLLIRQNKVFVEHYSQKSQDWIYKDFDSLDRSVLLESMNIEVSIAEIYRDIDF